MRGVDGRRDGRLRWRRLGPLGGAARAAIVMPAVFACAEKLLANQTIALFAGFGAFAMLVMVDFGGPARRRFVAYLALAGAGAILVVLGTLCSVNAWLAAGAMGVVGFAVLFSGVVNGYLAAAGTAAVLAFVLPVTLPAPSVGVTDRLAGWALAAGASIAALMLLWPPRQPAGQRGRAAGACRAAADVLDATLAAGRAPDPVQVNGLRSTVDDLRRRFLTMPRRPTGPSGPATALASLPDELEWLVSFLASAADQTPSADTGRSATKAGSVLAWTEHVAAARAVAAALRASAARLDGADDRPDLDRLDRTRDAVALALAERLPDLSDDPGGGVLMAVLDPVFRISAMSYSARQIARHALTVSGTPRPVGAATDLPGDTGPASVRAAERIAVTHTSTRSVWFRNSLRGGVGLAAAVFVAQQSGARHSFWIVLGTLSVLRTDALGTGSSVLRALAGTAVGIGLGAAIIVGIGHHEAAMWAVLPAAVLLATYAPRALSFAAGQAGFTVVVLVLFDLIQPSGWQVGLVRITDVAIGFAVSLGVGVLFWPRGAASLLRTNLASAYARGADHLLAAARQLAGSGEAGATARAARDAAVAVHRLDDVFRQYLAERAPRGDRAQPAATLVAGVLRLSRTAQSLAALDRIVGDRPRLVQCAGNLDRQALALRSWFVGLGDALVRTATVPPPGSRDTESRQRLIEYAASGDPDQLRASLPLLWASRHLDNLWHLEAHLRRRAARM